MSKYIVAVFNPNTENWFSFIDLGRNREANMCYAGLPDVKDVRNTRNPAGYYFTDTLKAAEDFACLIADTFPGHSVFWAKSLGSVTGVAGPTTLQKGQFTDKGYLPA